MSDLEFKKGGSRRGRSRVQKTKRLYIVSGFVLLFALIFGSLVVLGRKGYLGQKIADASSVGLTSAANSDVETTTEETTVAAQENVASLIEQAERLALGYDYDKALELLQSDASLADNQQVADAIAKIEQTKSTLVRADVDAVPHVFFHSLIVDTSLAFDGDQDADGYNQVMTTVDEFNNMIQNMYDKGFVLVGLHDMGLLQDDGNGNMKMTRQDIMLPEGKHPIVISQDDVNYYEFMEGDGFASRLVIDTDGRVTTEMDNADGTSKIGAYDLIPLLNQFIDEHPDFSYRGAKAIIALTGYSGVFGYRTDPAYAETNPNMEQDKETVRKIAQALRDDGFEIASHSWGHKHLGKISEEHLHTDSQKWEDNVETLVGDTDIMIFPFGTDVGEWMPYEESNTRYTYLRSLGFHYFCNVDSAQSWVQFGKDYLRQGRRNLDGYRMWRDITEPNNPKLMDLFDSNVIFDKARPTPVGVIRS